MLHIVDGEAKWVSHGRCLGFFYSLHILQSSMCTHKTYPTNFHGLRENLSYCKSANNPKTHVLIKWTQPLTSCLDRNITKEWQSNNIPKY